MFKPFHHGVHAMPSDTAIRRPTGHGRPLRKLVLELAVVIVAKLAVLMLIWYVAIRPLPRADVSPDGVGRALAPASFSSSE
jgi:hypothetical protein